MKRFAVIAGLLGVAVACSRAPSRIASPVAPPPPPAPSAVAPAIAKRVTPDAPFRAGPPPVAPATPFVAPEPVTLRLRNGIPLTLVHQSSVVVAVTIVAAGGIVELGADKAETLEIMMPTMMNASKTRSSDAIDDELVPLMMPRFDWTYYSDGIVVSARMMAPGMQRGVELVADVLLHPAFEETTFAWYVDSAARRRDAAATDVAFLGGSMMRKALFGQHPYSAIYGSSADARAVKRSDITALHARLFDASRLSIVVAGDVNDNAVFSAVDAAFGGVARRQQAPRTPAVAALSRGPRIIVVDRPGTTGTEIDAGFIGPAANAAEIDGAEVALELLAGSTFGRVTDKLRKDLHATSGRPDSYRLRAGSLLSLRSNVPTEHVAEALLEMERQMKTLAEAGPTDDDLALLHDNYAAFVGKLVGTPEQLAHVYALASLVGVPPDALSKIVTRRATIDAAAIKAATARWLDPTRMRVVLIGDWATMRDSVTALGWGVTLKSDGASRK